MKIIRYFFFLILLISPAFATSDPALELNQLLSAFQTYQATFKQITRDSSGQVIQTSHGRVMILRPGRFRWESDVPTKQIIITDSKILWVYNVDLSQATQQPVSRAMSISPASLLSASVQNLKKQFKIARQGNSETFTLSPQQNENTFQWIQLTFQQNHLVSMKVLNNLDETSTFEFQHIRINAPLSSSLFEFKPPGGVDVVITQ